jgi:ferredoxin
MPEIIVLPHAEICPEGATFEAKPGVSICDNLLQHGIEIEHACEKSCACTTCHVIVRQGSTRSSRPPTTRTTCSTGVGAHAAVAPVVSGDRRRPKADHRDSEVHDQPRV